MRQCRWGRSWFTAQEGGHDDRTTLHDGSPKQKPADLLGAGRSVVASPAAFACPAARPSPASAVAPPLQPPLHPDRGTEGRLSARVDVPTMGRAMFELLRLGRSGPRRRPCPPPGPCGSDQAAFEASRQTSGWWWLTGCSTAPAAESSERLSRNSPEGLQKSSRK